MPEIGDQLRETRMRQRIDITEVEAATKIRAKYLRALENEEWDLLPGPTFVKTFLRTYADYLGLDARNLVEQYRSRYERPSAQRAHAVRDQPRQPPQPAPRRPTIAPWMLILAGLIVLVGALLPRRARSAATTSRPSARRPRRPPTPEKQANAGGGGKKEEKGRSPPG